MDLHHLDALTAEQRHDLMSDLHGLQEGVCFICQRPLDLEAVDGNRPEVEYIQPLEAGGADVPENLALVHLTCASTRTIRDLRLARALAGFDRVRDDLHPGPTTLTQSDPESEPEAEPEAEPEPEPEPESESESEPEPEPEIEPEIEPAPEPVIEPEPEIVIEPDREIEPDPRDEPVLAPADSSDEPQPAPAVPGDPPRTEPDERSYGAALGLTVLGAVVPGSAYLAAGRRRLGLVTLGILVLLLLVPIVALLMERNLTSLVAELVSRPTLLEVLGVAVLVVAAGWVVVIATGHRLLLPSSASPPQQVLGGVLALLLAAGVATPSIIASRYAFATHDLIESVFNDPAAGEGGPSEIDRSDPWKDIPRLNLLLLGGDSTPGGGQTTNTMIVISVDTTTGEAVLIGLPRNLQNAPLPVDNPLHAVYPSGYACGDGPRSCLLSGLYTEAKVTRAGLFDDDDPDPGLTTLRGAIHEITGLEITYHLLVDLAGFEQIVDSLGGIDVNVGREPVPVVALDLDGNPLPPDASTRYIPPGPQHLDGAEALAFARERDTDTRGNDNRLRRQVVVITAIVDRADPVNLLLGYLEIASTASDAIRTDVPVELLPALVDLSQSARTREVPSLPIPVDASLQDPDFEAIRELVQQAIAG